MASSWCTESEYDTFKKILVGYEGGSPSCYYCKKPISLKLTSRARESYTIDHLKPRALYPEMAKLVSNMVSAHKSCNSAKGTQTAENTLADIAGRRRETRPEWT